MKWILEDQVKGGLVKQVPAIRKGILPDGADDNALKWFKSIDFCTSFL
jgi:hypothetical protein